MRRAAAGDKQAEADFFDLVYGELHRMAVRRSARGPLGATVLVHEAYLKLERQGRLNAEDRGRFFARAARAMRDIIVDQLRSDGAHKRGGKMLRVTLEEPLDDGFQVDDMLDLDAALRELGEQRPEHERIAELALFGGLTHEEIAAELGLSVATARRRRRFAYSWIVRRLNLEDSRES